MADTEVVIIEEPNSAHKKDEKQTHTFVVKDCPVVDVKIYNDRAEVGLVFNILIIKD
jgi:hypothetical protein